MPYQLSVIMKGKEKRGNISKNMQQRVLRCEHLSRQNKSG
ncbi:hypothetical protein CHCC14821_2540 [Bacillus paralicheniformis]|nr:hypothetical protein CHCC14821_2540 [Bacillus paralicheniformis]TWM56009.1 hypothetical protein CHCC14814_1990 [Bacillus paralicheniformis]